jgi:hypothetical protein
MSQSSTLFIGMDVHTDAMAVAGAAPAGGNYQSREYPCPTGARGRRLGLSLCRHGPPASATAPRKTAKDSPGHPLEGPGQAVETHEAHRPTWSPWPWPVRARDACGPWPRRSPSPHTAKRAIPIARLMQKVPTGHRQSRSLGFGVPLDGVQSPLGHTRAESAAGT